MKNLPMTPLCSIASKPPFSNAQLADSLDSARAGLASRGSGLSRAVAEGANVVLFDQPDLLALGDVLVEGASVLVAASFWTALLLEFSPPAQTAETLGLDDFSAAPLAALLAGMLLSGTLAVGLDLPDPLGQAARLLGAGPSMTLSRMRLATISRDDPRLAPLAIASGAWPAWTPSCLSDFHGMLDALSDALPYDGEAGLPTEMLYSGEKSKVLILAFHAVFRDNGGACALALFDATARSRQARLEALNLELTLPMAPSRPAIARM